VAAVGAHPDTRSVRAAMGTHVSTQRDARGDTQASENGVGHTEKPVRHFVYVGDGGDPYAEHDCRDERPPSPDRETEHEATGDQDRFNHTGSLPSAALPLDDRRQRPEASLLRTTSESADELAGTRTRVHARRQARQLACQLASQANLNQRHSAPCRKLEN
jgi:hypothetical protein